MKASQYIKNTQDHLVIIQSLQLLFPDLEIYEEADETKFTTSIIDSEKLSICFVDYYNGTGCKLFYDITQFNIKIWLEPKFLYLPIYSSKYLIGRKSFKFHKVNFQKYLEANIISPKNENIIYLTCIEYIKNNNAVFDQDTLPPKLKSMISFI